MGDLSSNLSRYEFACDCGCGFDCADHILVGAIQKACNHFAVKVIITGGNRCRPHNAKTPGASPNSFHIYGKAADHHLIGVDPRKLYKFYDKAFPDKFGIILYHNRVHLDVRSGKYREIK